MHFVDELYLGSEVGRAFDDVRCRYNCRVTIIYFLLKHFRICFQKHRIVSRDGNVTVLDTGNFIRDSKPSNIILLIGNEGIGIPPEILRFCDKTLIIGPHRQLHPMIDSLNVSVATGIMLQFIKNHYMK